MADGSIRISTKIDTTGAKADLSKLEKECDKTAQKIGETGKRVNGVFSGMSKSQLNSALSRVNKDLEKANAQIAELDKQINSVQADTNDMLPKAVTDEQAQNLLAIEEIQIGDIVKKRDELASKAEQYRAQQQSITAEIERQKEKQIEQNQVVDKATEKAKKLGNAGKESGEKTSKAIKKATKSTNSLGASIGNGIKSMGRMAIAIFGIRGALSAVRRAVSAYMEDNERLSNQMSSVWKIAGQAIGPFVEAVVKGISTAVMWVNSLIKALSGIDLVAKANAAAMKKQAKATGDAAKAARQLAGFDEMNKLSDTSGGVGGAAIFDTSFIYDIPDFMEEIKQKILAGDWFGAGQTLGESLMDGIASIDWSNAGNKIGNIIINALKFALGFILSLDIGEILSSARLFVSGLFDAISKGIQDMDWKQIGRDIVDFLLSGFSIKNTGKMVRSAAELGGSIIGALAAAIVGMGERIGEIALDIWDNITGWFDENIDWGGYSC